MENLEDRTCTVCRVGAPKLSAGEIEALSSGLDGWRVAEDHDIRKVFRFKDFKTALEFVNAVGAVAEAEGHHPDIFLSWGRVEVVLFTHKIDGLHENDFIMAAKTDRVYRDRLIQA